MRRGDEFRERKGWMGTGGKNMGGRRKTEGIHLTARPLHLLEYIQRAVHDELVHGPRLVGEVRRAVAALLRRAELILEEGVVLRADYHEVVRHVGRAVAPSGGCSRGERYLGVGGFGSLLDGRCVVVKVRGGVVGRGMWVSLVVAPRLQKASVQISNLV